jgi:hypothetical protein
MLYLGIDQNPQAEGQNPGTQYLFWLYRELRSAAAGFHVV